MHTYAQTHMWYSDVLPPCTAELCLSIRSRLSRHAIRDWRVKNKKKHTFKHLNISFLFQSIYMDIKRQHTPAVLHLLFNDLHHVLLPKAVLRETWQCSTDQVQTATWSSEAALSFPKKEQTFECWWNTRRHCKYSLNDMQRPDDGDLSDTADLADARQKRSLCTTCGLWELNAEGRCRKC